MSRQSPLCQRPFWQKVHILLLSATHMSSKHLAFVHVLMHIGFLLWIYRLFFKGDPLIRQDNFPYIKGSSGNKSIPCMILSCANFSGIRHSIVFCHFSFIFISVIVPFLPLIIVCYRLWQFIHVNRLESLSSELINATVINCNQNRGHFATIVVCCLNG